MVRPTCRAGAREVPVAAKHLVCLTWAWAGLGAAAVAVAQPAVAPAAPVPHCVGDAVLAPAGPRAWLDEEDRAAVMEALQARFPQIARDGLDARALLLWRHAEGDWRLAALIDDARQPGRHCIAATFTVGSIPPALALLRKYFFADGSRS